MNYASPQKENGYTAIANEIMEALIKYNLPGSETRCLFFILRKTYGYNKKTDSISLSQFMSATGLTRKAVARAIKNLVKKNIVHSNKGGVKNDTILTSKYTFNKCFQSWKNSVKNDTGSVKIVPKVVSKLTHTKDNIQKTIYSDKLKTFVVRYMNYISKTYPTKSPKGKNIEKESIDTLDKLIRLDGFKEDYIFDALRWAQKDSFWKYQIFSIAGLRKKSENKLTKFQNLSISYEKTIPEQEKELTENEILEREGLL